MKLPIGGGSPAASRIAAVNARPAGLLACQQDHAVVADLAYGVGAGDAELARPCLDAQPPGVSMVPDADGHCLGEDHGRGRLAAGQHPARQSRHDPAVPVHHGAVPRDVAGHLLAGARGCSGLRAGRPCRPSSGRQRPEGSGERLPASLPAARGNAYLARGVRQQGRGHAGASEDGGRWPGRLGL
jgi:hypothetical protein